MSDDYPDPALDKAGEWFEAVLLLAGPLVVVFVLVGAALGWWSS